MGYSLTRKIVATFYIVPQLLNTLSHLKIQMVGFGDHQPTKKVASNHNLRQTKQSTPIN